MTDEPALLAAIAARPDDDTPRLVYADWLAENGDPDRAEFIRLQCAFASYELDDPADAERADELENRHRIRWLAGVPTGPGLRWAFRRGFPEQLEAETRRLLDRYERIAAVPWLRELCLQRIVSDAAEFANRPWSSAWTDLELVGPVQPGPLAPPFAATAVRSIVSTPQVARLRTLRLSFPRLWVEVVEVLADSPFLDGLERLGIPGDPDDPRHAPLRAWFGDRLVGDGG